MTDHSNHTALSLFAGTGVSVALRNLGAGDLGVDNARAVLATRKLHGMETVYEDAWDAHLADDLEFDTLLGSPPCPTFSLAGNGSGRRELHLILQAIADGTHKDLETLRAWADGLEDARTGLTLSVLHYVHRFNPMYVAFEQVPQVLPVWRAMAEEMGKSGYSTWAGVLNAEQFGVPQTRKRAFLMARRDGFEVKPPVPTHSKYHNRTPDKLDPGVAKWVAMEEAIGWLVDRPSPTVTGGGYQHWRRRAVRDGSARRNQEGSS